jgi:hypothetical protein
MRELLKDLTPIDGLNWCLTTEPATNVVVTSFLNKIGITYLSSLFFSFI